MDRRQVLTGILTGMAAKPGRVVTCGVLLIVGMVVFLVGYREPKPSAPEGSCPSPKAAHLYDPEKRKLLGPVKRCIEEMPGGLVHTSEYGPDHKLIAFSFEHDGKVDAHSSSDSSFSETRDAQGRILSRKGGGRELSYKYDETGKLQSITNNQDSDRIDYRYDVNGTKTSIQTFDPKTHKRANGEIVVFDGTPMEGAMVFGNGVPTGGSVITAYDEFDSPIEMRILTADGQIVSRFVRKYDASGRVVEERTLQQNDGWLALDRMSPEQRAALTPQQAQDVIKENANVGWDVPEIRYKYNSEGCLIEKRQSVTPGFEHTTTIYYNGHGDIERKRDTWAGNLEREVRYSYRYDSFNNWTEKVVKTYDSNFNATTATTSTSSTTRRTITYY
jgi:YD repeat-containing protein